MSSDNEARSSSASHFSKNFGTASVGSAENYFYGISLSSHVLDAPAWQIAGLVVITIAIILQPRVFQTRRIYSTAFWGAIVGASFAIPETTLIPFLSTIVHTRTAYPYMVVIPHCIVSAANYRSKHGDDTHYLRSLFLSFFLYGFGGSLVSDILMGLPATALSHSRILPCYLLGWSLVWFSPFDYVYRNFMDSESAWSYVLKGCEAIDAVTTPMGRVSRSARELQNRTTAPVMAGVLAGFGGAAVRHIVGEPSSTMVGLESAFWKTLCYSVLWSMLTVYPCDSDFSFLRGQGMDVEDLKEMYHCKSYGGSNLIRVIIVSVHTLWTILVEMGIVQGHPFVWLCRNICAGKPAMLLAQLLKLGPASSNASKTISKESHELGHDSKKKD